MESIVPFLRELWKSNTVQCCKIPSKNAEYFVYSIRNSEQDLGFVFQCSECAVENMNQVPLWRAQNPLEEYIMGFFAFEKQHPLLAKQLCVARTLLL